eukprot:m.237583 g.237583  ORF g.237583 m.237583 type:complete len:413 (+) comp21217_c0_seq1:64-1302(+)
MAAAEAFSPVVEAESSPAAPTDYGVGEHIKEENGPTGEASAALPSSDSVVESSSAPTTALKEALPSEAGGSSQPASPNKMGEQKSHSGEAAKPAEEEEGEGAGEDLDPRVEEALTELNRAIDAVNETESAVASVRQTIRQEMDSFQADHAALTKQFGKKTIDKARPYYDALMAARRAHYDVRRVTVAFDRISNGWKVAKENVAAAETALGQRACTHEALEQLNAANQQLRLAEESRRKIALHHGHLTQVFEEADAKVRDLGVKFKQSILKTRPYFESKVLHNRRLAELRTVLMDKDKAIPVGKQRVAAAMRALETISEEIHTQRRTRPLAAVSAAEKVLQAPTTPLDIDSTSGAPSVLGEPDLDEEDLGEGDGDGDVAALTAEFMNMADDPGREESSFDDSSVSATPSAHEH